MIMKTSMFTEPLPKCKGCKDERTKHKKPKIQHTEIL